MSLAGPNLLTLKLFGAPALEAVGRPVVGRAAQGQRLALLAILVLARGRPVSRDKLTALLWPESPAERARHQLSDALYIVRTALGADVIRSAGDELVLNPDAVSSDVGASERLLDEGQPEAAVELFAGPLLDGFHVTDGGEFERWLDGERARLEERYAAALEALAEGAEERRDFQRAADWWKRRAAHDPYDSRVALRLMQALDASGNRAGALQHASVHERLLGEELGVRAAPAVAALVERMRAEQRAGSAATGPTTVTSRPVPLLAVTAHQVAADAGAVAVVAPPPPAGSSPEEAPPAEAGIEPAVGPESRPPSSAATPPLPAAAGGARRWVPGAVVLLAALVVAALAWVLRPAFSPPPERSLAVLPFVNMSRDGDNEYFSDGITEEIITQLSAIPTLKVISRTSAMRYRASAKSLRQIAEELDVAHVLEGSVRREGDRVRISAQLIDAGADHHLWSESYDRELVDVFAVQEEIAREVGRALEVTLGGRSGVATKRGTRDPEAYELYLRGRYHWERRTKEGHEQAIAYYRGAIERDSSYADPYAGLADVYLTAYQLNIFGFHEREAEAVARHKWAAERAVALDDRSAAARTSMAVARWWQRDWPGAERELRRAIELNPGYSTAHTWYALLLAGMGRLDEAVDQGRRAFELDPFALLVNLNYAWVCYVARDYDCAIEQFRKTLEINDTWRPALAYLGVAYAHKRMHEAAVREVSKAVEPNPQSAAFVAELAYVHALAGRKEEAGQLLQRAKANAPDEFSVARVYAALNEPDSAFAWLERSSWVWPHRAVRADPALDPLRSDPRFARLSARVMREMGIR